LEKICSLVGRATVEHGGQIRSPSSEKKAKTKKARFFWEWFITHREGEGAKRRVEKVKSEGRLPGPV